MKYFRFIIFGFILMTSCKNHRYYGYVYDFESRNPIKGVTVQDIQNPKNKILTDDQGKFYFSECNDLIVFKNGYKIDTLKKYGCKPKGKCFDGHIFYMQKIR